MDTTALPAVAPLSCWVLSDGRRGIENQALGLAESLGEFCPLRIQKHVIKHGAMFKALPAGVQFLVRTQPADYDLNDTLPRLAIGCGRQAIAPLRALKKAFIT